jgi:diguanylate cyclase (GGDEF)-like protein/PAS domain S-box-containing protein
LRSVSLVRDPTGAPLYFIVQIQDIDALKQAEAALRASEARYRQLVELAQEGIWQFDTELRTTYVNQRMAELLGCRKADVLGRLWWEFMDAEGRALAEKTMATYPEGHAEPREYKFIRADGRPLWALLTTARLLDASGERSGAFATVTDITTRKRDEDRLRHAAQHDALTGLVNRAFFTDQLDLALAVRSTTLALLVLDLNGFKSVNDSLGHAAGDVLLRMVALRLQGALRATDTITRLGGNEFAMILHGTGKYGAMAVARKAMAVVKAPLDIQGHHVEVGGSIGIALAPQHGTDSAILLHRADAAMYRAKRNHLEIAVYILE